MSEGTGIVTLATMPMTTPDRPTREELASDEERRSLTGTQLAGRWISIGIQLVVSIVLGLLGGQWLDKKFDTDPWFTLIGILVGAAAAFYDMYRLAQQTLKKP